MTNDEKRIHDIYQNLCKEVDSLAELNQIEGIRSRHLSLAITNLEQCLHWLEDALPTPRGVE
jgi:hypothetical protein